MFLLSSRTRCKNWVSQKIQKFRETKAVTSWENKCAAILGHRLNDLSQKCGRPYEALSAGPNVWKRVKYDRKWVPKFKERI